MAMFDGKNHNLFGFLFKNYKDLLWVYYFWCNELI